MSDLQTINDLKSIRFNASDRPPLPVRLAVLSRLDQERLACFTLFSSSLTVKGIEQLFTIAELSFESPSDMYRWLSLCLRNGLACLDQEEDHFYFSSPADVLSYFENELPQETRIHYHQIADRVLLVFFAELAIQVGIDLPEDESARRTLFLGWGGLVDQFIHAPQYEGLFRGALTLALGWYTQLAELGSFDEAARIANIVCFSVARDGRRDAAESILAAIIPYTSGRLNLTSRSNLATLLREEGKHNQALRIYKGVLAGLLVHRDFRQLVVVLSEMGAIYRQKGQLFRATLLLEVCSQLHGFLKNGQSQAIARSQLASVYRYQRLYGLALNASRLACGYFRKSGDYLNMGRSLLTHGNILYNMRRPKSAIASFDEALTIGKQIADPQAICGALGGKARVFMFTRNLNEVKPLLDETIAIRQRNSDHSIGIEYQNLGHYYELVGNDSLALVWYEKALKSFKQYMPVEVPNCKRCIARIQKKQAK
jgi:tetratricopeptide (TPR) repeat protein